MFFDSRPYRFEREATPSSSHSTLWSDLAADIDRGWAKSTPMLTNSGTSVLSVSYKETHQEKYHVLPIGARSLLIGAADGELHLRGVNKFGDITRNVLTSLTSSPLPPRVDEDSLPHPVRAFLQEKLAGFIVHLFSLDGVHLEVMSKHVLQGTHVDIARAVLFHKDHHSDCLSDARWISMLQRERLVVSGELIDRQQDKNHPVLERLQFDKTFVVFAVGRRDTREEQTWPWDRTQDLCQQWGLRTVPTREIFSVSEVEEQIVQNQRWTGTVPEGHVLLLESRASGNEGDTFVVPIRFKIKTLRYRTVRLLRSLLLDEVHGSSPLPLGRGLFPAAVVSWWAARRGTDGPSLQAKIVERGIDSVVTELERECRQSVVRLRDAPWNVSESLRRLISTLEAEALSTRSRFPHDVVLLVGLPGAGKSTLCQELVERVQNGSTSYRSVIHISRDDIAKEIADSKEANELSRHKARRQKLEVHQVYQESIEVAVHWLSRQRETSESSNKGLLLLDAVHATLEARDMVRAMLPPSVSLLCCHLQCSTGNESMKVLAERCAQRIDHPTLASNAVQEALFKIHKVFRAPTPAEMRTSGLLELDTSHCSVADIAQTILSELDHRSGCASPPSQASTEFHGTRKGVLWSTRQLSLQLQEEDALIIQGLVGEIITPILSEGRKNKKPGQAPPLCSIAVTPRRPDSAGWSSILWERVAQTLYDALELDKGTSVLKALWTRWCCTTENNNNGTAISSSRPVPQAGHLRWVAGQLLQGMATVGSVKHVQRALEERFSHRPVTPHVTVVHLNDVDGEKRVFAQQLEEEAAKIGTEVTVVVDALLMDEKALCVHVSIPQLQMNPEHQRDFHITLGHTHHVRSVYCKEMFSLFADWEAHNATAAATSSGGQPNPKRIKQKNFVRLPLHPPIKLEGVLAKM